MPVVREKWSSAGAHARGMDDELVQVCALLEMVDEWCDFIEDDVNEKEMKQFRRHERTGRRMGDKDHPIDMT